MVLDDMAENHCTMKLERNALTQMENLKKTGNFTKYPKFNFANQFPKIFSETMWNSECSLNNLGLVNNRSINIVIA